MHNAVYCTYDVNSRFISPTRLLSFTIKKYSSPTIQSTALRQYRAVAMNVKDMQNPWCNDICDKLFIVPLLHGHSHICLTACPFFLSSTLPSPPSMEDLNARQTT